MGENASVMFSVASDCERRKRGTGKYLRDVLMAP
jgi:hypothetical protein